MPGRKKGSATGKKGGSPKANSEVAAKASQKKATPTKLESAKKVSSRGGSRETTPKGKQSPRGKKEEVEEVTPTKTGRGRSGSRPATPTPSKGVQKKGTARGGEEIGWKVGDVVEALWDDDGFYYDARVEKVVKSKGGITYDIKFVQDKVTVKGRKPSQLQPLRSGEESESEEEVKTSRKKKKEEDAEYTATGGDAEDYDDVRSNRSENEDSDDETERRKKPVKRKRRAAAKPNVSKKRKTELRDNIQKLRKDEIVDLVCDIVDKKSLVSVTDLEKGVSLKRKK